MIIALPTVYIKKRAANNLKKLFDRLLNNKKYGFSRSDALDYVNELRAECFKIVDLTYHRTAVRSDFSNFGKKVYAYKRNSQTEWYIIYDFDRYGNVIIKRIKCNHEMKK